MEYFCTPTKPFFKGWCAHRHNHEFLYIQSGRQRMAASIDDIHHRHRKTIATDTTKETIQRNIHCGSCSSAAGNGNSQNRICSQFGFIFCAICFDHGCIYCIDIRCIHTADCLVDFVIDMIHCFLNALSQITFLITITQLQCFKFSCGCSTWRHTSSNRTICQIYLCLYGWITSGIQNLPANYFFNF